MKNYKKISGTIIQLRYIKNSFVSSFSSVYAWVGMILLFLSIARMTSHYFEVGFYGVIGQIIAYYVLLTSYFFLPLELIFDFNLSQMTKDLVVIWISGHSMFYRVISAILNVTTKADFRGIHVMRFATSKKRSILTIIRNVLRYDIASNMTFDDARGHQTAYLFTGFILWPYFMYHLMIKPYFIVLTHDGLVEQLPSTKDNTWDTLTDSEYIILINVTYVILFQMFAVISAILLVLIVGSYSI